MHAGESFVLSNVAAGTYPVVMGNSGGGVNSGRPYVMGGRYALDIVCTGTPSLELKKLGPDGSTYLSIVAPFNNAGTEADLVIGKLILSGQTKNLDLAPGVYEVVIGTSTANYVALTRVPVSN